MVIITDDSKYYKMWWYAILYGASKERAYAAVREARREDTARKEQSEGSRD